MIECLPTRMREPTVSARKIRLDRALTARLARVIGWGLLFFGAISGIGVGAVRHAHSQRGGRCDAVDLCRARRCDGCGRRITEVKPRGRCHRRPGNWYLGVRRDRAAPFRQPDRIPSASASQRDVRPMRSRTRAPGCSRVSVVSRPAALDLSWNTRPQRCRHERCTQDARHNWLAANYVRVAFVLGAIRIFGGLALLAAAILCFTLDVSGTRSAARRLPIGNAVPSNSNRSAEPRTFGIATPTGFAIVGIINVASAALWVKAGRKGSPARAVRHAVGLHVFVTSITTTAGVLLAIDLWGTGYVEPRFATSATGIMLALFTLSWIILIGFVLPLRLAAAVYRAPHAVPLSAVAHAPAPF